jgi:hypothetical protein
VIPVRPSKSEYKVAITRLLLPCNPNECRDATVGGRATSWLNPHPVQVAKLIAHVDGREGHELSRPYDAARWRLEAGNGIRGGSGAARQSKHDEQDQHVVQTYRRDLLDDALPEQISSLSRRRPDLRLTLAVHLELVPERA